MQSLEKNKNLHKRLRSKKKLYTFVQTKLTNTSRK